LKSRDSKRCIYKSQTKSSSNYQADLDDNLAKYCKLAGIRKYSAHKFRHGWMERYKMTSLKKDKWSYNCAKLSKKNCCTLKKNICSPENV